MRKAYIGFVAVITVLAQAGCARMSATTHVKPDGSYTRIVRFTVNSDASEPFGGSLRDTFKLPAGSPWNVTKAKTKDETVYEAQQTALCGQTIRQDVDLKADGKSKLSPFTNDVTVRSIGPGRFEYREVLHGKCDSKDRDKIITSLVGALKAVLPATRNGDVRFPAKMLTSNGQYDKTQNEVFWALYPDAVAFDDVILTATWQVDNQRNGLKPVKTSRKHNVKLVVVILTPMIIFAAIYYVLKNRNR